ncbi:hypothetical protein JHK82_033452 [Glycine max]|nr:hypothetical protein JHK85_034174 [Glycine max]KAG4985852.1 hypothetical protein JHK86_033543 [Glycine max]KAG5119032.1 hypothetical protein JHK82_033452 [Glycine max]KAG5140025.1 hypothetical protein JHK84_033793 [Glycine max]
MVHALELPAHWKVPWFEVKWHVKQYKKEKHMDPNLLELAKLNFNLIHAKLQMEVKELSRWWENLGIKEELSFARNRLVEASCVQQELHLSLSINLRGNGSLK